MKKLQSNFTTKEQSKRLLELGVPKNSANLYYNKFGALEAIPEYRNFNEFCDFTDTPCWSVGRLIEIVKICSNLASILGYQIAYNTRHKTSLLHIVIQVIEEYINEIDFSKLEE